MTKISLSGESFFLEITVSNMSENIGIEAIIIDASDAVVRLMPVF